MHGDVKMFDEVGVVDGLEYPQFLRHALQCPVVVVLQGDLLHGHDVAGDVVDGGVDLPKVALTWV